MAVKIIKQFSLKQLQFLVHYLFFYLLCISATSLTFNFRSTAVITNLSFQGEASLDGSLRLTNSAYDDELRWSVGRATFHEPFLLRQNSTRKLADFTSTFTFY
ncbi:hypothetical protein M0R45_014783 [Rubus argutus]|uniref:Legume lectin domain-containing protein n=1 Tax=Rubus argutus TaxID=59490 RepID=A0AAW1XMK8_RUBAR